MYCQFVDEKADSRRQQSSQYYYYGGMRMRTVSHTVLLDERLWSIGREETEFEEEEEVEVIQFVLISLESCYGLISMLLPCCIHTHMRWHTHI